MPRPFRPTRYQQRIRQEGTYGLRPTEPISAQRIKALFEPQGHLHSFGMPTFEIDPRTHRAVVRLGPNATRGHAEKVADAIERLYMPMRPQLFEIAIAGERLEVGEEELFAGPQKSQGFVRADAPAKPQKAKKAKKPPKPRDEDVPVEAVRVVDQPSSPPVVVKPPAIKPNLKAAPAVEVQVPDDSIFVGLRNTAPAAGGQRAPRIDATVRLIKSGLERRGAVMSAAQRREELPDVEASALKTLERAIADEYAQADAEGKRRLYSLTMSAVDALRDFFIDLGE